MPQLIIGQTADNKKVPIRVNADGELAVSGSGSASSAATLSNVSGSASSVLLLAANANRKGVQIHNDSAAILYLNYGATASATAHTVKLYPGDQWEMPTVFTGALNGIWTSATGAARITELA